MIPLHRLEQTIPDLTGLAVLIIAGCAFALSFFNLQEAEALGLRRSTVSRNAKRRRVHNGRESNLHSEVKIKEGE